ncbi:Ankyrin repeat domain containing protein [Pandoravirus quercus]|uniref:Ankyrin repeat domain containing protein n=2 Tax=Pandoravirus TaxID=2060084 RepID=A0A2U7UAI6_9VIRU|nr:Ankyrin repeat domain containing protein [Pandoravirus quercus]AVK75395.1 Ankyrin repeat domain containing protein [Pandoravirus quercus]QBZ81573.1 ankyrin repeat domain containing protein [Pandoravirus celtis]
MTTAMTLGMGESHAPPWDTLPPELWREVLLRCPSDRDLYACLCAARCFHALTSADLAARFYADATVEGMCAAGDMGGLEYAMAHRPASAPPINWPLCLSEAGLRGNHHVVAWIVEHVSIPGRVRPWEDARVSALETQDPLLCAMVSVVLLVGREAPITSYARQALGRLHEILRHTPPEAKAATVRRCEELGGGWARLSKWLCWNDEPPPDIERAESLVRLDIEERTCRLGGDVDVAQSIARRLAEAVQPQIVNDLIRAGRLDAAANIMTNPATHTGLSSCIAGRVVANVARASVKAGRIDLLDALGCFDARTSAIVDIYTDGRWAHMWTVIVEAAAGSGHNRILERMWGTPAAPDVVVRGSNAVATAVVGGHAECVRWLCERGFPVATAEAWSPLWQNRVSALSLALLARRTDMADLILATADADAAARRAFSEAVAAGDLRVARYIRRVRPSAADQRPPPVIQQRDPFGGAVLVPLDRDDAP